jgi:putative toxin-antitoxin system antitoxin component (TIGR02293 family)
MDRQRDPERALSPPISAHLVKVKVAREDSPHEDVSGATVELGVFRHQSELETQEPISSPTNPRRIRKIRAKSAKGVVQFTAVFEKAIELFDGNTEEAMRWFQQPKKALGGKTPLDCSKSEEGAHEVENLIGRLQHGVFS